MDLTGWPAVAVLSSPFAILILVILASFRPRWQRRGPALTRPAEMATGRYGTAIPAGPAPGGVPLAGTPLAPRSLAPRDELLVALDRAEAAGDERALATLYLARGRQALATGDTAEAGDKIRRSIRISSRLGLKDVHAVARIELGDMAHASGDLTTACEHWQIARGLFFDMQKAEALQSVEARMQQNGCPTDWVLNDF